GGLPPVRVPWGPIFRCDAIAPRFMIRSLLLLSSPSQCGYAARPPGCDCRTACRAEPRSGRGPTVAPARRTPALLPMLAAALLLAVATGCTEDVAAVLDVERTYTL